MKKENIGSDFDDFLKEEGIYDEVNAAAVKEVIAFQVEKIMNEKSLTKSSMAQTMRTSRAAVDRILDPTNVSLTLQTMQKVAGLLGKKLKVEFV
jgi:antitoxin HicB